MNSTKSLESMGIEPATFDTIQTIEFSQKNVFSLNSLKKNICHYSKRAQPFFSIFD